MLRNRDPFAKWNNRMDSRDPFKPWNNPMYRNDPFAPWNQHGSTDADYKKYCKEQHINERDQ